MIRLIQSKPAYQRYALIHSAVRHLSVLLRIRKVRYRSVIFGCPTNRNHGMNFCVVLILRGINEMQLYFHSITCSSSFYCRDFNYFNARSRSSANINLQTACLSDLQIFFFVCFYFFKQPVYVIMC